MKRPQRILTEEEWEHVRDTPALTLHKALILGLVDPVPNPSPMPEEAGAWVREHVWPRWIRVIDDPYPWGYWRWSNCERGSCWNCINGRCDICVHRQKGGPDTDSHPDIVHALDGRHLAPLLRPDDNPVCTWLCRCPCPKTGPIDTAEADPPAPAPAATTPPRPRPAPAGQEPLITLEDLNG
ncbi:DUF6248 family natural product biosynthesis protein [Nocardiopsis sp. NPDC057823]|uniref:DUF6248 family natural product biosynthesis protein n=1 Tax=Nocardiopsis sp. NPDC057823 TaxID=3346256 RepID=UPI00366DD3E3